MSQAEAARARGVSIGAANAAARRLGLTFKALPHGKQFSRKDDEDLLRMLWLRCQGFTPTEIATKFGLRRGHVSTMLHNVLRADIAESTVLRPGEPDAAIETVREISAGYW